MTDRIPLDELTSDQLDALYERVAKAEQEADSSVAAAAQLTTLVGKRSERAERLAQKQRSRADIAERELRVLRSGLRANGADPTQIQNLWAQIRLRNRQWREEKKRADQAEALLRRYVDLAAVTHKYRIQGGHDCLGENHSCAGCALAEQAKEHLGQQPAALDEPKEG